MKTFEQPRRKYFNYGEALRCNARGLQVCWSNTGYVLSSDGKYITFSSNGNSVGISEYQLSNLFFIQESRGEDKE